MKLSIKVTGLDRLLKNLKQAPKFIEDEIGKALRLSIAMIETESKRLTPVATIESSGYSGGNLRSSIGGADGYLVIRGLTAEVGTNVRYAIYVHERTELRHIIGQAKFMEQGAKNSEKFIGDTFRGALEKVADLITQ